MILQTYISNKDRIVHLRPRPPIYKSKAGDQCPESKSKESNLSARFKSGGSTCEECGKHLQDEHSRWCSIICKVTNVLLFNGKNLLFSITSFVTQNHVLLLDRGASKPRSKSSHNKEFS